MPNVLKFLQANLGKCPPVQQSLFNDEGIKDFGAILVSEPHCPRIEGKVIVSPIHHRVWEPFFPTSQLGEEKRWAFRSMLWINKKFKAKQISVDSSDVTAAVIEVGDRTLLLVSVYIPPNEQEKDNEKELSSRLSLIKEAAQATTRSMPKKQVEVLIAGNFNRWDQLWSGV